MSQVLSTTAVSDANGNVTLNFPPVNQSYWFTGSVSIPGAMPNSILPVTWRAFDSGAPWGVWYNDQSSATLQISNQLVVVGTGLAPNASFTGFAIGTVSQTPPPLWPGPNPAPPPTKPFVAVSGLSLLISTLKTIVQTPSILGSSTTVVVAQCSTAALRVLLSWPTAVAVAGQFQPEMAFDIDTLFSLVGWTVPNLGPLLVVQAQTNSGTLVPAQLEVITGTPFAPPGMLTAQAQNPNPFGGLLSAGSGTVNAGQTAQIPIFPYVGNAMLFISVTNPLNVGLLSLDFTGTQVMELSSFNETGSSAPIPVKLPSLINRLQLNNPGASAANWVASLVGTWD